MEYLQMSVSFRAVSDLIQRSSKLNYLLDENVEVMAVLGMPDGSSMMKKSITALAEDYEDIGQELANEFLAEGARELLNAACAMGEEILRV